ncbi:hypothetical protein AVEN_12148-1 [Araneus ventricosus]|uniref:Uncharacterized protein n=1 Tax=Araneus ventricosus TaxID=182803 RepID=A0A4Y2A4B4_ARAVE|nr:hypothetical protein AVEN_270956-1 [Araneus ventricosus]GBL74205.1 hypothetical protein AVEN_12148-1 [Araneus ventricosus]
MSTRRWSFLLIGNCNVMTKVSTGTHNALFRSQNKRRMEFSMCVVTVWAWPIARDQNVYKFLELRRLKKFWFLVHLNLRGQKFLRQRKFIQLIEAGSTTTKVDLGSYFDSDTDQPYSITGTLTIPDRKAQGICRRGSILHWNCLAVLNVWVSKGLSFLI